MNLRLKNTILAAMLAALVCVATMVVSIPTPLHGYINLGDCLVLLSGWMLPPVYAFLAAGIGSGLADIFASYVVYAPITFLIKGIMALFFSLSAKKTKSYMGQIAAGLIAELIMVLGYYVFEGFLYGFIPSAVNIPMNLIQGAVGLVLAIIIINIIKRQKFKI